MDEQEKKSLGVYLIAVGIILSNLIVFSILYKVPFLSEIHYIRKAIPLIALAAVYPYELFQNYFKDVWIFHAFWMVSVMLSSFGLLFYQRYARIVFISFNIIQIVLLLVVSSVYFGKYIFWGYFFKCYFAMVAFFIYVGYITLPEIRAQFQPIRRPKNVEPWYLRLRRNALGPKDAAGYYNLAIAYQDLGRIDESIEFLTRATSIVPDKAEYQYALGKIHYERLDFSNAIKYLREAVSKDPIHQKARYYLGLAYQKTGCLEEAVQSFRRATFVEPQNVEFFRQMGIACFQAGHLEESEQALRKAMMLDANDPLCPYYLGMILIQDPHRAESAEEQFKKAIRIDPNFIDGYRELGNLYVGKGDYKAAVRAFRDVLRLDPNVTHAHYQLGFAYAMLKDIDSARRVYQTLKDIDPDLAQTLGMLISRT